MTRRLGDRNAYARSMASNYTFHVYVAYLIRCEVKLEIYGLVNPHQCVLIRKTDLWLDDVNFVTSNHCYRLVKRSVKIRLLQLLTTYLVNYLSVTVLCLTVSFLASTVTYLGLCGGCSFLGCNLSNPFSLGDGAPLCGDVGSSLASSTTKSWNRKTTFSFD